MLQREMEKGNRKRMRLESSRPMFLLCKESLTTISSLETHLASYHRELCFLCSEPGERDRTGSGDRRMRFSGERRSTFSGARERGLSGEVKTDKYG